MWNNGFRVLSSLKLRRDTQGGPPPPIYMRASCARAGCMDEVDEVDEVDEKQHGLPPSLKLCRDKKAHPTGKHACRRQAGHSTKDMKFEI